MNQEISFGQIVKERRTALGLTQAELARRVGCAAITIRKIEADALRPSVQVAELLAIALNIPEKEQLGFIRLARADQGPLPIPTPAPAPEEIGQEDLSGRAIRGFQLGELIGAGGFGVVYKAVQTTVEREVAVKIILPKYANHPDFIRRFEFEAQLVARLEHPFVVPLYDYWREPDAAYLIMRLLRGGSLESVLKGGPLSLEQVNQFVQQIGLALHAAHRAGVIHRDIKPANILLDEDNNAYLADFGIAKDVIIANGNRTEVGGMVGSPAYISPEQIRAEPVKPQADIYCLGIMLFELLTGRKPFTGPTPVAYIQQHLQETPPSLLTINPALPARLDQVIQKATAKHPADRYPDMVALLADFHQALPTDGVSLPATEAFVPELSTQELAALENPFKGLRPFHEADAADFYGRDTLIQELLTRLSETDDLSRFLAVVGPSGSGKSSVVRAGLVPALRRGGLPGSDNWFIVEMMPGSHPFEEVEAALLRIAINPPQSLLEQLREDRRGLLRAVQRVLPTDPDVELLLVIDQFEELFTLVADEESRAQFLDSLVEAVLDERSRLRLVVTLRADFVDRPLQYVDFGELVRQRAEFVLPLTADELEQAITRPVAQLGLAVEPELVAHIVREVGDQPGTLPLLQYALTELFERRTGGVLTRELYERSGGVLGALGRRAEEIYNNLDVAAQVATKQLFLRLITLGEGVENTRRRVLRSELLGLGDPYQSLSFIQHPLEEFGKYRLLTFDNDPSTREPTVEVAHEALLHEWDRLRQWLAESRADIRFQRLLAEAAAEWRTAQEDSGFLLRGTRLDQLEGWAEQTDMALTQNEKMFLAASLAARRQRRTDEEARRQRELETARQLAETERRRAEEQTQAAHHLRRRAVYLASALVIAAILSVLAFNFATSATRSAALAATREEEARSSAELAATRQAEAEAQARLARSRALAGAAVTNLKLDPELSVLLALRAIKTTYEVDGTWTTEAEAALHQAVQEASRLRLNLSGRVNPVSPIAFSADGTRLVGLDFDGRSKIWDALTGQELLAVAGSNALLSRDGQHLITLVANEEGNSFTRMVWDTATGEALASSSLLVQPEQGLTVLAFSPEGTVLAAGYEDGTIDVWDFAADATYQLHAHSGRVNDLAFSADGGYLVTASSDQSATVYHLPLTASVITPPLFNVPDPSGEIFKVALSPGNTDLVTINDRYTATIWHLDLASGEATLQSTFSVANHNSPVAHIVFSPHGLWLASAGDDKVLLWEVLTGRTLLTLPGGAAKITFSPDGTRLMAASSSTLKIWDLTPAGSKERQTLAGHEGFVFGVAFSPDGTRLATAGLDGQASVWDWAAGKRLLPLSGHQGAVQDIQFSPDGKRLATAGHDSTARIWDAVTGQELLTLRGHGQGRYRPWFEGILALTFSPDGARLATAGLDGTARIWDTSTGQQLLMLPDHVGPVKTATFSPDGMMLATVDSDLTFHGWDASTGEGLFTVSAPAEIMDVVFSPDGQRLAAAIRDASIKVWDVEQLLDAGQRGVEVAGDELALLILTGHTPFPWQVMFSPDGKYLASLSSTEIDMWAATTGQKLLSLPAGESAYGMVSSFSPDGRYLAAGKGDGTTRVFALTLEELVVLAQSRLTRGWAMAECIQYHIDPCPSAP